MCFSAERGVHIPLISGEPVHSLLTWGSVDRVGYGNLLQVSSFSEARNIIIETDISK